MNTELRRQFKLNSWSRSEGLLMYFREMGCYESAGGQPKASPHWYGTIVDFNMLQSTAAELIKNHSIKRERMREILDDISGDGNQPAARLTGIFLNRVLFGGRL